MRRLLLIFILILTAVFAQKKELTLDDCIKTALDKSPDLHISKKQLQSSQQGVKGSYSNILPNIGIGYGTSFNSQGATETYLQGQKFIQDGSSHSYHNLGLQLNQNIYDGGAWWNKIKFAKNSLKSTELTKEFTRLAIIQDVTEKFYSLLKSQQLLLVYNKSLENSQKQLKKTEEMHRIGQVAKKDLFKSQVREGNDRLNVISQKSAIKNAIANLNVAMGQDPGEHISINEGEYTKPQQIDEKTAWEKVLSNNVELRNLKVEKQNANLTYKITKANLLPSITGSYRYSRGGDDLSKTFSGFDKWWNSSVGLNIGWSIFSGFQRKTNIQQSKISYNIYNDRIAKKKIILNNQTQVLIQTLDTYREMISIYELNIKSAQEDLRLAQEMYRLNSATLLEVLDAQVAYTRAQADLIRVKYDAKIAEVQLAGLMGNL